MGFSDWLRETGKAEQFEDLQVGELAEVLREFYCTVQKKDGTIYSLSSMSNIYNNPLRPEMLILQMTTNLCSQTRCLMLVLC